MLNWLIRYATITPILHFDGDARLTESVLDVGCGPHGLACAASRAEFVGVDVLFPDPVAPGMVAFRNEPGPLPFADRSFDCVVCLDVLEHIPRRERVGFVEELTRVAAQRVLIACPSADGAWGQEVVRQSYLQRGIALPWWLNEHDEHGLPTAEEIHAACAAPSGFTARELPMTNGLLATMMVIADMFPEFSAYARAEFESEPEAWVRAFEGARFGSSGRRGYLISRDDPATAVVDVRALRATVWNAVRCPVCEHAGLRSASAAGVGADFLCPSCGHRVELDETRAYDLRSPANRGATPPEPPSPGLTIAPQASASTKPTIVPTPVSTTRPTRAVQARSPSGGADLAPIRATAPVRLLLSPDWEQPRDWLPAVATFVAASPDGRNALCVDATSTTLGVATVHEMLWTVCDAIAGDRRFGEIVILDTPFVRDGTVDVSSAEDVRRRLDIAPDASGGSTPEHVATHAAAAKQLADRVMAIADRRRFLDAPDPWTSREPLVTVRIATWRKPRLLTERAIPSVLGGLYGNVELLVCSDGPDPETAAAVAAIRDPRLRYMEMPHRPVYPEQRWSMWEIAGSYAVNRMVSEARGTFLAPLCHDDAFTEDHIPLLLAAMAEQRSDLAYGQVLMERSSGPWHTLGRAPLEHGHVTHGACLYSGRLRHMPLDPECWVLREPGDWNLIRRVTSIGATASFVPQIVLAHFAERSMVDYENVDVRSIEAFVADIDRTGLSWLLDVPVVGERVVLSPEGGR